MPDYTVEIAQEFRTTLNLYAEDDSAVRDLASEALAQMILIGDIVPAETMDVHMSDENQP